MPFPADAHDARVYHASVNLVKWLLGFVYGALNMAHMYAEPVQHCEQSRPTFACISRVPANHV